MNSAFKKNMQNNKLLFSILLIAVILIIDQALKVWIKTTLLIGEEIPIFEWFRLNFAENEGMAFSMKFGGEYGKLMLTLFRIVAVGLLSYWLYHLSRIKETSMGIMFSLSLITAGALGNIIDCLFYGILFSPSSEHLVATFLPEGGGYAPIGYGKVVDMFWLPLYEGFLPEWLPIWGGTYFSFFNAIFNVADAAISIGVVFVIIFQRELFKNSQ